MPYVVFLVVFFWERPLLSCSEILSSAVSWCQSLEGVSLGEISGRESRRTPEGRGGGLPLLSSNRVPDDREWISYLGADDSILCEGGSPPRASQGGKHPGFSER